MEEMRTVSVGSFPNFSRLLRLEYFIQTMTMHYSRKTNREGGSLDDLFVK
jgi:hypothetical protein